MNGLPAPQSIAILKNSDQYLIFSCTEGNNRCVYKMSYTNNDKLFKEMYRLQTLKNAYPKLSARLPEIHSHGTIAAGIHTGRAYFIQEHIPGITFSHYVQTNNPSGAEFTTVIKTLINTLVDIALDHTANPAYDHRSGSWLKEAIQYEYNRIQALPNISHIANLPSLIIDGVVYQPLHEAMSRLFSLNQWTQLDSVPSFISSLGHWNFHGDNVMFDEPGNVQNFKVIDPDVKIDECDPLFGLARFFYSFPHDTVDYVQYLIHSDVFSGTSTHSNEFRITYLWPQVVYQHYASLLDMVTSQHKPALVTLDGRFAVPELYTRLQLCMLYCLIRGVYANYEEEIEFVGGRLTEFRNKSIYLYLQAVMFAHTTVEQRV